MTPPLARRWGPGTSAIVRALIAAGGPVAQVELAALVGVSQPRVSQVLATLAKSSAVSTRAGGYVGRKAKLVDLYVINHRPALVEPEAAWYSVQPMREQADALCDAARVRSIRIAFSADLAPDVVAPWRHPTLTVVYADRSFDLSAAGFVPAEGRVDATLLVRNASDSTLLVAFEPWPRSVDDLPLADPVQQIWDLHDLGGEDREEAAQRLRRAVLDDKIAVQR